MRAPDLIKGIAAWEALFGLPPTPAPALPTCPVLVDAEAQRRAYSEDLGRRLASPDRTPEDVLEALDWGEAR